MFVFCQNDHMEQGAIGGSKFFFGHCRAEPARDHFVFMVDVRDDGFHSRCPFVVDGPQVS